MVPLPEEDYRPPFLTVRLTGIERSREQGRQSGGCAPSTKTTPSPPGFQLMLFVCNERHHKQNVQNDRLTPTVWPQLLWPIHFTINSHSVGFGKTVYSRSKFFFFFLYLLHG